MTVDLLDESPPRSQHADIRTIGATIRARKVNQSKRVTPPTLSDSNETLLNYSYEMIDPIYPAGRTKNLDSKI